jgi:hydroxymethylpyrimidine pyrophosphatase-like HAD family hydrolase
MSRDVDADDFNCDKFVIWFDDIADIPEFRKVSDKYFECIDRGENFREFVPIGYSKATGLQQILDLYDIPIENAYALGDSNNDLPMLSYVPNSIAMGNSDPTTLFNQVSYVTTKSSENGIENALRHYGFI